jgi:hypothetical protein
LLYGTTENVAFLKGNYREKNTGKEGKMSHK